MPINRTTAAILLVAASIPALASSPLEPTPSCVDVVQQALYSLLQPGDPELSIDSFALRGATTESTADLVAPVMTEPSLAIPPRQSLAAFAMTLRDIRYRRGGRAPKTGFDCSGFVQYVFAHSLGIDLPDTSVTQFLAGTQVARSELQTGDLVFFHTRGRSVSHVGIYLDNGRFIHSPSTGKRVRVDELSDRYWARRYMGARRPTTMT
ncbi:MAG TPA: C40 family peptidase [Rudaea sp.]|jgi:cell wall-associated NlpC family hydrolase